MSHVLTIDLINGQRTECQPQSAQLAPSALAREAIEHGPQMVLRQAADLEKPPRMPFGDSRRPSASLLYVPLRNGASVVGILSIQSYSPNAYSEEDLTILEALADHCSGALDRIRAHHELVEMSRQAGMAEVATGVLHNVGNVLNSVNVSIELLLERQQQSYSSRLARIVELLNGHATDLAQFLSADPRGKKVTEYLGQLARAMEAAEKRAQIEHEGLAKNVQHIKQIVAMQQSYARMAGVVERVDLVELLEDVLHLNAGSLARHQITVQRDYAAGLPVVTLDKHKVLQILVNLVRNAKYACDESGRTDKKVTLRVAVLEQRLRIQVADNGIGIPAENLNRLFSMGFSTRKTGHGFGLHSGAVTAKELGGSLTAQSKGPGQGAIFTLELPFSASN